MRAFLRHVLIPLIAITAIALVIWFAGPLLSFAGWAPLEHPYWRIALIMLLYLWWLIKKTRAWMIGRRYNEELAQQVIEAEPESDRSAEEVQLLRERLQEALDVLKKARLGGKGENKRLYQIPWYLIIGPPGAGKTTALVNSGLQFPLAERFGVESLKGVGGTRHCDWWFTNEAVLIDTAGRYTTQDSDRERDAGAWKGFLGLLKRYRKRQPINGALVAISVSDLLTGSESERRQHAQAVRSRLQELQTELGVRFPIYVMFTKCDLLAGFNEFFDDLGRGEREQVWGFTLDLASSRQSNPVEHIDQELELLASRIGSQVVDKLQHERSEQRRQAIYAFPQQFAALEPMIRQFLTDAFSPTRYEQDLMLRGCYFTSATQEGTPIDRVMGALSRSFGISGGGGQLAAGRGQSYFLTRLLQEVIFPEAALAGVDARGERRRKLLQWGTVAASVFVLVLAVSAWSLSFVHNRGLIAQMDEFSDNARINLRAIEGQPTDLSEMVMILDELRELPHGYAERGLRPPRRAGFGLYQGEKMGQEARRAYVRMLHSMLLPQLIYRAEDRLRQSADAPEFLYETLKVYLMLERPRRYDAEIVDMWFQLDLERFPPQDLALDERESLALHVQALADNMDIPVPFELDEYLIADTRTVLRAVPLARRILQRLEIEAEYSRDVRPFRVSEQAGPQAELVFQRASGRSLDEGISGLYTYAGYHRIFRPELRSIVTELLGETWVLGDEARSRIDDAREVSRLIDDVRELYFREFVRQWENLLGDLEIVGFGTTTDAVRVLRAASGTQSPIRWLLGAIADEVQLTRTEEEGGIGQALRDAGGRAASRRLTRMLPREGREVARQVGQQGRTDPEAVVEDRFRALIRLAGDGDLASDWPIDQPLGTLRRLAITFEDSARGVAAGLGTTADLTRSLREDALSLPEPVSEWLGAFSVRIVQLSAADTRSQVQRQWASQVLPVCRELTGQRYPFRSGSTQDLSLQEFGRLFGHGGLLDQFFDENLRSYADTSAVPWRWRPPRPGAPTLSADSIRQFEQARRIRDAFFPEGGQRPVVQLDLRPVEMDQSINRLTLRIGEQTVEYFHGPIRFTTVRWPDPSGSAGVRLQFDPPAASGRSAASADGPWALLRFLEQFRRRPGDTPESMIVEFEMAGRKATYEIRAHALVNPLTSDLVQRFQCPSVL
ncbi:MAG: type VI secretion system membrane subunit TssM [Wenzhouxiangella sp.]|nr:type VI secretion system membrane subunit TssM [Wenzhouxiangella sp.]